MSMGQAQAPVQAGPSRPPMAMPTLSTTKSVAALSVAAQVTAQARRQTGLVPHHMTIDRTLTLLRIVTNQRVAHRIKSWIQTQKPRLSCLRTCPVPAHTKSSLPSPPITTFVVDTLTILLSPQPNPLVSRSSLSYTSCTPHHRHCAHTVESSVESAYNGRGAQYADDDEATDDEYGD